VYVPLPLPFRSLLTQLRYTDSHLLVGKRDAQAQLDNLLEEMNKRKMCLEEFERRAAAAALVEERMRYCVLVGCLKPLAVSVMMPASCHYYAPAPNRRGH